MNRKQYIKDAKDLINELDIDEIDKKKIILNWVSYIEHFENKIFKNYFLHNFFSIIGIVGGISIPAMSAFKDNSIFFFNYEITVSVLGIITASCIAINLNQKHDEKWKHFRRIVELVRIEGEAFFSLSGESYSNKNLGESIPIFMEKLTYIKTNEVSNYFDTIYEEIKNKKN